MGVRVPHLSSPISHLPSPVFEMARRDIRLLIADDETFIRQGLQEALQRLQNGEVNLAVHPNCGTNIVTAGVFAGVAGALAMLGAGKRIRDKLGRIPMAATLATLALIVAQPLGLLRKERVTTSGIPGSLEVVEIIPTKRGRMTAHRVVTKG